MTWARGIFILIAAPVLALASGLILGLVLARGATIASRLAAPQPKTLIEAVKQGQKDAIVNMVQAGADPGRAVVLKHPMLGWRKGDVVSPLLVGIAEGNSVHVAFLFKNTKRKDHAPNDQALCVAARFGHGSVASMLFGMGVPAAPQRGCDGRDKMPEEVAARFGNGSLAKALKTYRQSQLDRAAPGSAGAEATSPDGVL